MKMMTGALKETLSPESLISLEYFLEHSQRPNPLDQFLISELESWNSDYRLESWLHTILLLERSSASSLIEPVSRAALHLVNVGIRPLWLEDFFFVVRTLVQHGGERLNQPLLSRFLELLQSQSLEVCDALVNLAFSYTTSLRTQSFNEQELSLNVLDRCLDYHLEHLYDAPPMAVADHYESLISFLSDCERTDTLFEFSSLRELCLRCPR